jgi:hypothetical protein
MSVPLRNPDPRDWLVDVIGAGLGAIAYSSLDSAFRRTNAVHAGSGKNSKADSSTA